MIRFFFGFTPSYSSPFVTPGELTPPTGELFFAEPWKNFPLP